MKNERETLARLLARLRQLDANGHAAATDGSMDGMDLAEQITAIRTAIAELETLTA